MFLLCFLFLHLDDTIISAVIFCKDDIFIIPGLFDDFLNIIFLIMADLQQQVSLPAEMQMSGIHNMILSLKVRLHRRQGPKSVHTGKFQAEARQSPDSEHTVDLIQSYQTSVFAVTEGVKPVRTKKIDTTMETMTLCILFGQH